LPYFRIQAKTLRGSIEMDYPNDREVLETFECDQPVSFNYAYKTITRANRALAASLKLSLRIDSEGLLSLQFMLPPSRPNGETHAFIEFKCMAREENL